MKYLSTFKTIAAKFLQTLPLKNIEAKQQKYLKNISLIIAWTS